MARLANNKPPTLEASPLGDAQQRQAFFERFGQRDGREAEPLLGCFLL
jgi:hypothetical protein